MLIESDRCNGNCFCNCKREEPKVEPEEKEESILDLIKKIFRNNKEMY